MSGGGSVPNAPDLSKQSANADQTFATATSDAKQTMDAATAYNKQSQDTVNNVVGQEMPMVANVNNSANQNLSTYGSAFVPLQAAQAQAAQNWGSEANVANQQGRAMADQAAASNASLAAQRQQLASEGVDPASVHGGALDAQARVAAAANVANAGNNAAVNTQLQSQQLINQANQLGLQVNQAGNSGAETGANIGNSTASTQSNVNAQDVNNLTASNSYLNTGLSANKQGLDVAQAGFSDQMQQAQMQQQQSQSTMSAIGSIAGAAMMFMEEGGPVPQGYEHGGPVMASGIPPRFMNPKSAAGMMREFYEHGGPVSHRGALPRSPVPGSTDTKPAMLTPGEFVIPHDAASWKGHEHWYKQIDKAREERAQRQALPPRPTSAITARGV